MFFIIGLVGVNFSLDKFSEKDKTEVSKEQQQTQPQESDNRQDVLGHNVQRPEIYISGGDQGYSTGGMIALASTDEPAVQIGGYNISGSAEVALYEANDDVLLDYLTHDKDGKQTKKKPDESKIRYITTVKQDINTGKNDGPKVTLPLGDKGIWYLKIKLGSTNADAFIVRSNIGTIAKEGDNEYIFWGQNFKTKRSINEGVAILYNLQDGRKELERSSFNSEGIAKARLTEEADIALVAQNDDRAVIPVNLKYLNTSYSYRTFKEKVKQTRYFIFTDRPLYKPGDIVYFKAILRDDDDARYTIPNGEALVNIYNGYYYEGSNLQPDFERSYLSALF